MRKTFVLNRGFYTHPRPSLFLLLCISTFFSNQKCHSYVVSRPVVSRRRNPLISNNHDQSIAPLFASRAVTEPEPLIPQDNPHADKQAVSLAGVRHAKVLEYIHDLFPPEQLDERNAASRTDGYWPYVQKGKDPPRQFTYGEFDFYFFAQLLDVARKYYHVDDQDNVDADWNDKVFLDIGSGMGRLVFSAAGLHPNWKQCRGIELLPSIHQAAVDKLDSCRFPVQVERDQDTNEVDLEETLSDGNDYHERMDEESEKQYELFIPNTNNEDIDSRLRLAPVEFTCGSFQDPYTYLGDADCIFVFSSCMRQELFDDLAIAIGRQCRPGTVVITTDHMLPLKGYCEPVEEDDRIPFGEYEFQLVDKINGWCWLTGGSSTAFIHTVVRSLWNKDQVPLQPRELSLEEKAFRVVKALESGELNDTEAFMRGVYNNIVFAGLPERFLPKINRDD